MNLDELNKVALAMVAPGKGILAADESSGTIKKRFDAIGVESTEDARRDYREMLFRSADGMKHISGVILYDETIWQKAKDGTPLVDIIKKAGALPGIKVDEIIEGGPLTVAKSKITPGMFIEKINGVAIAPGAEFDSLLNHLAGKPTLLAAFDPAANRRFEETVKPVSLKAENDLLYRRWVKRNRDEVDRLSGGRLGYVHVRSMDDESYRDTFSELLGRESGKEAVIVDTRFNGGGNLHDELATLLDGKAYLEFLPRGQSLGWEPALKWTKPSVVLISESNYSDAHLFPWVYRHLGIGKLIGMPVAGTGTAVWWETQQDDTLYYGIPMVGFRDRQGEFMEKALIKPDIEVRNDPARVARGEDQQLEKAVDVLLGK